MPSYGIEEKKKGTLHIYNREQNHWIKSQDNNHTIRQCGVRQTTLDVAVTAKMVLKRKHKCRQSNQVSINTKGHGVKDQFKSMPRNEQRSP